MKLAITREWFERKVELEGDLEIGAGDMARSPSPTDLAALHTEALPELNPSRIAFGSLIEYLRRKRGLSMEKLAEEANIELAEIVSIERDAHFRPEPRTVFQIAQTFDLPNKALLQLSGNSTLRDSGVHEQAMRFAARSGESVQDLSKEEQQALEEFVAYLAKM